MNIRMPDSERNECATQAHLLRLGNKVERFGQHQLPPATRELLRGVQEPKRWLPDFLVRTVTGEVVFVDSKFSYPGTFNHSIEMRSLAAALLDPSPIYYVCSRLVEGRFVDFKSILATDVPMTWPCCPDCGRVWKSVDEPAAVAPLRALTAADGSCTAHTFWPNDQWQCTVPSCPRRRRDVDYANTE